MPHIYSVLFGAAFTAAFAYALGRLALDRFTPSLYREERRLLGFAVGAGLLGLLLFALASLRLIYDWTLLALGAAAIGAAWKMGSLKDKGERLAPLPRLWAWLFWLLYGVFALIAVIHAAAPEWSPDGSGYHLGVMARYYRAHGFVKITSNMYANLSQGVDLIYLNAFAFGRHSAAALTHCAFLLALPLLILCYGRRTGHPHAGAAAALFTLLSPVVMVDGSSAYNDVAVACLLFAVFYLCRIDAPPLVIGMLAGACYAAKYTAFVAVIYAAAHFALRRRWRDLAITAAAASVFILPWMARNWIWFGNPFSPLLNAVWPNPYVHASFEQDYAASMRFYEGLASYRDLPLELTVRGQVLNGFLGPLFLLAPLGLVALRHRAGRVVLGAAALFALPYAANIGTRFLIPALPFVSLALALSLPRAILPVLALAHATLSFPDVPKRYVDEQAWRIGRIPFRQALRLVGEESWLTERWPPYRVARMVERSTPPGAVVLTFTPVPESYTTRDVRVHFQSAEGERLYDMILVALIQDFQPVRQLEFTFPRQTIAAVRAVQTASPATDAGRDVKIWSMAELRLFDQGRELKRAPDWRLNARPNPWDVQLAFDNEPVTRWRSWEQLRKGMYVEVEFGEARPVERLLLETSGGEWDARVEAEGRLPSGEWKALSREPRETPLPPPFGLRRAAMEELKRAGITHLLVDESNFRWEDFRANAALWGIREAASVDRTRLYRLE